MLAKAGSKARGASKSRITVPHLTAAPEPITTQVSPALASCTACCKHAKPAAEAGSSAKPFLMRNCCARMVSSSVHGTTDPPDSYTARRAWSPVIRSATGDATVDVEGNISARRTFRWNARNAESAPEAWQAIIFGAFRDPSEIAKFAQRLPNPVNAVSASGGYKDAIGRRPAQLLVNLESNRFETLDAEWIRITGARAKDRAGIVIASLE